MFLRSVEAHLPQKIGSSSLKSWYLELRSLLSTNKQICPCNMQDLADIGFVLRYIWCSSSKLVIWSVVIQHYSRITQGFEKTFLITPIWFWNKKFKAETEIEMRSTYWGSKRKKLKTASLNPKSKLFIKNNQCTTKSLEAKYCALKKEK